MAESSFQAVCEAAAERYEVPALAAGMAVGGRRELASVGCAEDARFRVASITKPFTATLALRHLSLDDELGVWPGVRVRHLLAHTSGYGKEPPDAAALGDGDDALARTVPGLAAMRPYLPPGEAWSYSNGGYWLAGLSGAERAGLGYEDAIARDVLAPAGLEATSWDDPDVPGWDDDASGRRTPGETHFPRARRPGGGLVSNVPDLLRFARWQLAEHWTDELRVVETERPGGWWGRGFALDRVGGLDVWWHPGSVYGFSTSLLLVPERDAAFVGLTNSGTGTQALRRIEGAFFERLGVRRERLPRIELERGELERLAGRFANPEGAYAVEVEDGALRVALSDGGALLGVPIGGREFLVEDGPSRGSRFDFLPGSGPPRFARIESRLAERA